MISLNIEQIKDIGMITVSPSMGQSKLINTKRKLTGIELTIEL